jgi:hypothetical protein
MMEMHPSNKKVPERWRIDVPERHDLAILRTEKGIPLLTSTAKNDN